MAWFTSATASYVSDFRFKRKFHSYLHLACVLLLIAAPVNARPKETESEAIMPPLDEELQLNEEYDDVDNIEFHQAKIVNGVLKEDHPVIMYKEDFVSEDFVPKTDAPHRLRKHKDPAHRRRRINNRNYTDTEQYHPLQPEKIYFDILSSAPIVSSSESKSASSKMHVEVISLADADTKLNNDDDAEAKRVLHKRPKKFHNRRQRRDTEHNIQKRNPYYRYMKVSSNANSIGGPAPPCNHYLPTWGYVKRFEKHPVPGNYHNGPVSVIPTRGIDNRFGGPTNTDRVIWRDNTPTRDPNKRLDIFVRPPLPLFPQKAAPAPQSPVTEWPQNNPAGAPSFSNEGHIPNTITTERPAVQYSHTITTERPLVQYPEAAANRRRINVNCVWAITSCCLPNDLTVRYNCLERYGCPYVFWDLNPCAEQIRDNIVSNLDKQFD